VSRKDLLRMAGPISEKIEEILENVPLLATVEIEKLILNNDSNDKDTIHPNDRKLAA
jgi:hypothetical protein